MPPTTLAINVLTRGSGRVHIVLGGELDLATAPMLTAALEQQLANGGRVLLDLSEVTFIDSSGLAAIINASNVAHDGRLEVSAEMSSQARRLMELTGVLPLLSLVEVDHS